MPRPYGSQTAEGPSQQGPRELC